MRTGRTQGRSCGRCGAPVPSEDAECRRCRTRLADASLPLLTLDEPTRGRGDAATVEVVPVRSSRRGTVLLVAGIVTLLGLVARTCANDSPDSAPPQTAAASSTVAPSTSGAPAVGGEAASATVPVAEPTVLDVPPGLRGWLAVLTAGGDVYRGDLATGALRKVATIEAVGFGNTGDGSVAVLEDGTVLVAPGVASDVWLVDPAGGSRPMPSVRGWLQASGRQVLLLRSADNRRVLTVDATGAVRRYEIEPTWQVVGLDGGAPVVEVFGRIGVLEQESGVATPVEVTTGRAVAANDWGLARIACSSITVCELRVGPWSDLDRVRLPVPPFWLGDAQLAPDGRSLSAVGYDPASGTPPARVVIDLPTGALTRFDDGAVNPSIAIGSDRHLTFDDREVIVRSAGEPVPQVMATFPFRVLAVAASA